MSFISHLVKAKNAGIRKSMLKHRQKNANTLKARLGILYKDASINQKQRDAIAQLRVEHTTKSRELAEGYMEKEIKIIEDLKGDYQPGIERIKA